MATPSTPLASTDPHSGAQPPIDNVTFEQLPIAQNSEWSDSDALTIALRDFRNAETYRTQNHEWRWQTSDEIYLAWGRRRHWEGTRIPRSSLQVHLAFQQIEALLPQVISALFSGDLDFDCLPRSSQTTFEQAMQVMNLLRYQMENLDGSDPKFNTLREIFRLTYKCDLIYGNGICEWGWQQKLVDRKYYQRQQVPEMTNVPMADGTMVGVPTGKYNNQITQMDAKKLISQPFMHQRDIRDFYIDPNCPSPNIQAAGFCATRSLIPIQHIQGYRGQDQFNIPDDETLLKLAKKKFYTMGDQSKAITEAYRGGWWQPTIDQSLDPRNARIEIIRYWQKGRHVWVFGREHVALNKPNIYNAFPFLNTCYADVYGRFYGMSICDLVECDQKFSEALLNARIDELNLILHPPIIKKRGMVFSPTQQRIRPGVVWDADNPQTDVIKMEMGNVTQQAFIELQQVDQRTQAKTGVTDLAVLGVASSGGNSANRTATGVAAQTSATNSRTHYQVTTIEDQFFQPLLNVMWDLNKNFLDPQQMLEILGPDGNILQLDPVDVLNSDIGFKLNTGSRMKSKAYLQSGGMMNLLQYMMNPQLLEMMAEQQNKTPDIEAVTGLFMNTYDLPPKALFRSMSPQEQQIRQQKMMMPLIAKQQLQGQRIAGQAALQQGKEETELLKAILKLVADVPGIQKILNIPMIEAQSGDDDAAA